MPPAKKKDGAPSAVQVRKDNLTKLAAGYTGDSYVEKKVQQGIALDAEKASLYERIAANRRQLRDMATQNDIASSDVDLLYPPKASANGTTDAPPEG